MKLQIGDIVELAETIDDEIIVNMEIHSFAVKKGSQGKVLSISDGLEQLYEIEFGDYVLEVTAYEISLVARNSQSLTLKAISDINLARSLGID